jgi:class 3 adenylate cyclase/TolB-like protein
VHEPARHLAAVWFADIVGYTALSSRDEDAAIRLVALLEESARAEIERHGGTLVKSLGDGVLARFPSTASAIRSALSLRDAFHAAADSEGLPSRLRIGVHVGDVVIGPTGDVFGDGVNVAARLHEEAPPGRLIVSEDVWRQCRQRPELRFVSLGPRRLKGIDEPMIAYEVALAGEEAPPLTPEASKPPSSRRTRIAIGAALAITLLAAAGYLALRATADRAITDRSIAVLPFETLGSDQPSAFTQGIQVGILTRLSNVSGLDVISRTSVEGYEGTEKSPPEIARELDVAWILRGGVQEAGDEVMVSAQLINAREDRQVWGAEYRRRLSAERVFDIQAQIAMAIIDALNARLTSPEAERVEVIPTSNLEAYRLYEQGRQELDKRTEAGMRQAVEYFERALAQDSTYALAWVGEADALALLYSYRYAEADSVLPLAERAVRRALELDSGLAQAHASLGLLHATYHRGPAGIQALEQAVALQPSYAEAHNWLSYGRLLLGAPARALESARRAVELNPLSPEAVSNLSLSYLANGEPELALVEARRTRALEPGWTTGPFYEALALYQLGRYAEAKRLLDGLSVAWAGEGPPATLAVMHVATGDSAAAREQLAAIRDADPFAAGLVRVALGEEGPALAAFSQHRFLGDWPVLAVRYLYDDVWRALDPSRYRSLLADVDRDMGLRPGDR